MAARRRKSDRFDVVQCDSPIVAELRRQLKNMTADRDRWMMRCDSYAVQLGAAERATALVDAIRDAIAL